MIASVLSDVKNCSERMGTFPLTTLRTGCREISEREGTAPVLVKDPAAMLSRWAEGGWTCMALATNGDEKEITPGRAECEP